jgi:hypothetical protein
MADDNPRDTGHKSGGRQDSSKSADNAQPLIVTIEPQTKKQYSYEAKTYRLERARYRLEKKAYCVAKWTVIFLMAYTGLTLAVAIASAISTYLLRQQLEATTAAFMKFELWANIPNSQSNFTMTLRNDGHSIARKIHVALSASVRNLPAESTIEAISPPWEFDIPELNIGANAEGRQYAFGLRSEEIQAIEQTQQTIRIEGELRYYDGFSVQHVPICKEALVGSFKDGGNVNSLYNCDEFGSRLKLFLAEKAHRDR